MKNKPFNNKNLSDFPRKEKRKQEESSQLAISSIHHSFDLTLATKLKSVELAILIHHFQYWIDKNRRANKNFHEGRFWMYDTIAEISSHFPYWSCKQVERFVKKLVDMGILIKGNFNKSGFDQTSWFAFGEKGIEILGIPLEAIRHFPESGNPISEIGNTIPHSLPHVEKELSKESSKKISADASTFSLSLPTSPNFKKPKEKPEKISYSEIVSLQEREYLEFCEKHGKEKIDGIIEHLTDYCLSKGEKYKDYAAAIRNWIRREKDFSRQTKTDFNPIEFSKQIKEKMQGSGYNIEVSCSAITFQGGQSHISFEYKDRFFKEKLEEFFNSRKK